MEEIPKDGKKFMMLFDGEWQKAIEVEEEGIKRWFKGDIVGFVPMDEIQDWKPIN
jgi:hypothetical protein